MARPPTTAPGTLSSPPRMTAGKTLSPMKLRASALSPLMLPTTTPAVAATAAAMAQEAPSTRGTLTPRAWAACWSSATARMATPSVVPRKKATNTPSIRREITSAPRWTGETMRGPARSGDSGRSCGNPKLPAPQRRRMTPPEDGREADRHHDDGDHGLADEGPEEEPLHEEAEEQAPEEAPQDRQGEGEARELGQEEGPEGPEGEEVALGQVEDAARLVDHDKAQRGEGVHHAHGHAGDHQLEEDGHPTGTSSTRTAVSTTAVVPSW